jgi:HSP20 family molecular chaperone IbpA
MYKLDRVNHNQKKENDASRTLPTFYDPFDYDNVFDGMLSDFGLDESGLHETDKDYILSLDVGPVDKKGVNISTKDSTITLKIEESGKNYHQSYIRSFTLNGADIKKATAHLKDGILTVTIPRTQPVTHADEEIPVKADKE